MTIQPTDTEATRIRAVVFRDGDIWVAQCLEYDIGAQAADLDVLRSRLMIAIDLERKESVKRRGSPFAGIDPAPVHFHAMWERAAGGYVARKQTPLQTDGALKLELALCA